MRRWFECFIVLLTLGMVLTGSGCKEAVKPAPQQTQGLLPVPKEAQSKLQTMRLWLGAEELVAELALTDVQRQAGMMFRTNMAENESMLFVFPAPHRTAFWMRNTPLPLSAAYIDPAGVILEIHDLKPHDTNSVFASSDNIQFVLETRQGWFQRHNISTGMVVRTERGALNDTFTYGSRYR